MQKKLVGITGGIGSGKSSVCQFWANHFQVPWIDLDQICRKLLDKEQPGWRGLRRHFGKRFFRADGTLNRRLLRQFLFADPALRQQVNDLIHPLARKVMDSEVASCFESIVLVEVPLLFEVDWYEYVHRCVVVYADLESRCRRLQMRDRMSVEEVCQSFASQKPLWEKAMLADHVVENSGVWLDTCLQVIHLGHLFL